MSFAAALARVKEDKDRGPVPAQGLFPRPGRFFRPGKVRGHFRAARCSAPSTPWPLFFSRRTRPRPCCGHFWEGVGRPGGNSPLEMARRRRAVFRLATTRAGAPFWWLRNPLGKMMVRSAVPYTWPVLQHYVYRSQELQARYDLVRLLARARLAAGPGMRLDAGGAARAAGRRRGARPVQRRALSFQPGNRGCSTASVRTAATTAAASSPRSGGIPTSPCRSNS